jgi:hypothetical protein
MDGDIRFNVGANTAQFDAGMAGVANSANSAAGKIKNAFSGLGGILAGGAALAGIKSLMNDLDAVAKMSTRFNTSAESIQRVSLAADLAGTSIDVVAQAMQKASIAASNATKEGGAMAEKFAQAGIDAQAFNKANLDEKLLMVARAFEAARGNADKTNAIIELLGSRSAGQLIPLLSNVEALQSEMANAAVASDSFVKQVEAANDSITRVTNSAKIFFANALEGFTQTAERMGNAVAKIQTGGLNLKAVAEAAGAGLLAAGPAGALAMAGGAAFGQGQTNEEAQNAELRERAFNQLQRESGFDRAGSDAERERLILARMEEIRAKEAEITNQTALTAEQSEEVVSKTDQRKQQMQQLNDLALQIKEAQADGNQALADDLAEYKALVEAAIKYEGDLEMAARDVNAAHKERLRLQDEALQKTIAQVEKEVALAETMAFGSDEAKKKAEWMKVYQEVLEKTGRDDLARRAANAETAEAPRATSAGSGFSAPEREQTNFERLSSLAKDFNTNAMADLGRIGDRASSMERRASELSSRGQHRSAARIMARAEKMRQDQAAKALERMGEDAAKPEAQRKKEEEAAKSAAAPGTPEDSATAIYTWLKETFMAEFKDRLPQTVLTT